MSQCAPGSPTETSILLPSARHLPAVINTGGQTLFICPLCELGEIGIASLSAPGLASRRHLNFAGFYAWFIRRPAGRAGSLFRSGLVPLREPATTALPR